MGKYISKKIQYGMVVASTPKVRLELPGFQKDSMKGVLNFECIRLFSAINRKPD